MNLIRWAFNATRKIGSYARDWVMRLPILLVLLILPYFGFTMVIALLCSAVGTFLSSILGWPDLRVYEAIKILFAVSAILLWVHYFIVALRYFRAAVRLEMTILGVAQLVFVTIIIFAAAHYYVALLSDTEPNSPVYSNLPQPMPEEGWADQSDLIKRLFFFPPMETIVNFIYFSTVTTATVGYGDIAPVTMLARVLTIAQIWISFLLVAVVLGWVIGNRDTLDTVGDKSASNNGAGPAKE